MDNFNLFIILASLLFSAFFSGMEIAFVTSNKLQIELEKKLGLFPAKIFSYFVKNQSEFISTMLVGNNIALVVYGIFMARALEPFIMQITSSGIGILFLQTIISTLLVLITAEFLPKTLFRLNANQMLSIFSTPVAVLYILLYPINLITIGASRLVLRFLFRVETSEVQPEFGRVDLDNYLKEAYLGDEEEREEEHEIQIFRNALDFSNVKARECMVPRTDIMAVEIGTNVEELRNIFTETGYSKILIYRDTIDNIIGYVHSYELFKRPERIRNILLPISIIPETMPANEILELFIKQRKSIAVVVDEFGGTSGMVTIEDVIEEIFGEIEDEHDQEILEEKQISENEFLLSARLDIDYINERFRLNLPESDDYETLAGLIINEHESIPDTNEEIRIPPFLFKIKEVSDSRIELVYLKIIEER